MTLRPIYILLCSTMIWACKNNLREVHMTDRDTNISSTYYIDQDSLIQGVLIKKYNHQNIKIKENYTNNKLNGQRIIYFSNDKINILENYLNGVIHGPYIEYHPNGNVMIEANYVDGVMTGILKKYYESGSIEVQVSFENNEENGPFTEYYESGQKHWEGSYLNGDNEFGLLIELSENGDTLKKLMCDSLFLCRSILNKEKIDLN